MGLGTGELIIIAILGLAMVWYVAPVVGIIRATRRRARRGHSAAAPILAGVSLGLLLCFWVLRGPSHPLFALAQLALHLGWFGTALQANRAATRAS